MKLSQRTRWFLVVSLVPLVPVLFIAAFYALLPCFFPGATSDIPLMDESATALANLLIDSDITVEEKEPTLFRMIAGLKQGLLLVILLNSMLFLAYARSRHKARVAAKAC